MLYTLFIRLYVLMLRFAANFHPKARKMIDGREAIFDYLRQNALPNGGYVWIHASSLGEFEQGRPLIEAIKQSYPNTPILVTFYSPSGYDVRKNYSEAQLVCYLPFDIPSTIDRFVDIIRPTAVYFVKYDFWSNMLHALQSRNIPIYLVSGIFRDTQLFFKPWGGFFRSMLYCFSHFYVQNDTSKQLLLEVNIPSDRISVTGDTRFDRVIDIRNAARDLPLLAAFVTGNSLVQIAGSSWPVDEAFLIPYMEQHPHVKLIIAPHEIHEAHLQSIEALLTVPTIRYSKATLENIQTVRCLIIDCFGLLSSIYRYGDIAYIGGGFGKSIHNVAEAAVYGIPVVWGPEFSKFKEAHDLIACSGGFAITTPSEYAPIMDYLTDAAIRRKAGDAAGNYIFSNSGAVKIIMSDYHKRIDALCPK